MNSAVSKHAWQCMARDERDHLTGLYNRKSGLLRLASLMESYKERDLSFFAVLMNINDLTTINHNFGHSMGDQVLVQSASFVKEELTNTDFAIRLCGDEFFILFSHERTQDIHQLMERIVSKLSKAFTEFDAGFCYGVLEVKGVDYVDVSQIITEVDARMYRYKKRYHLQKMKMKSINKNDAKLLDFMFDEEYLLHALMESTDEYIYVCNLRDHPTTFCYSKAMVEEFDLPSEVIENAADVWGAHIHEADQKAFLKANEEIANGVNDCHNVEYRARNKDGKWVWLRCRGHVERDSSGQAVLFAGFITCLNRKNKVDYLTGLFNKYEFEDTIEQMLLRECTTPFYIMKLDVDEFSTINKLYNNHFGDKILEILAQKIQSILPEEAKIFRSEGDEFYVLLRKERTQNEVRQFFQCLQQEVMAQQEYDGKKYHCTISAGCTYFPDDAQDYMTIVKSVGYALEYAKKTGRNKLCFFDKKMLKEEMQELDMIEQLRYSVEHGYEGFRLNFQPQVHAKTGKIVGTEALARWRCDMYGNVPPLTFIPLLEKSGLIIPVGKWIFEQAVRQCKNWILFRPDFGVSINLSYLQLNDPAFLDFMRDTLEKYKVNPRNIVVEMTESRIMKSTEAVRDNFLKIRDLGIRIAMDDFGTGYSSLGALKTSPADIVKIDKIFMKNILVSEFDATFIKFVVRLCHDVGISVLLEGVETKEEYEKVRQLGLDFIQGYFFGKPMEGDSVEKILT